MSFEFKLPDLGEGIREAQVLAWRVTPGQDIAAFQALCEVESAKAAVELTAPVAGRVVETRFSAGDTARLGDVLVIIDTDSARGSPPTAHDSKQAAPSQAAPSEDAEWFGIVGSAPSVRAERTVRAAPFVRKLARDRGVRLEEVAGSGPGGRVRIADVEATAAAGSVHPTPQGASADHGAAERMTPPASGETLVPMRGLRKSIAEHMLEAWRNAPQVTSMDLFDVTELVKARERLLGRAAAEGVRLSYLPLFVKAAVQALRLVPEANAVVDEQQSVIRLKTDFHIGIATAIAGGLVVPVVRHADRLSVLDTAREIDRLVSAARERRSTPADLSGSTFTVTSFGGLPGSPMFATPIVNYPEVAILGLGRIDLQPRVVDGQIVARHCIGVSFTFDHRALDGEGAGRFMAALKRLVEQPLELLLHLR